MRWKDVETCFINLIITDVRLIKITRDAINILLSLFSSYTASDRNLDNTTRETISKCEVLLAFVKNITVQRCSANRLYYRN